MQLHELLQTVHKLELLCQRLTQRRLAGLFESVFKGRGATVDQVRKYEVGDNVKDIDWNVTARVRETFVKTYIQEKERLLWLLVDVSGSVTKATRGKSKYELEAEIALALAFSALESNSQVGVIFYSDQIECLLQPARGKTHLWRIAKAMVDLQPVGTGTDPTSALHFLLNSPGRNSVVVLLSDFAVDNHEKLTRVLAQQHELLAIRVFQQSDSTLPRLGWVRLQDAEREQTKWMNTSSASFKHYWQFHQEQVADQFQRAYAHSSARTLSINIEEDYMQQLITFLLVRK